MSAVSATVFLSACVHEQTAAPSAKPSPAAPAVTTTNAKPAALPVVATPPVFVPDTSHENEPLRDGILTWDGVQKSETVAADATQAHFQFSFTNVSGGRVVILDVHPSCGCTTAELPPRPWIIAPGTNGTIKATVNIAGKSGTVAKAIDVMTDKGKKQLIMVITISAPVTRVLTEAQRAAAMAKAKVDRQEVFRGDCASCHVQKGTGKYGEELFSADCAICHESPRRASFVPNLRALKVPTNVDFWKTWIAHGKPGSFMPAFSQADGGPLTDMQIMSLAAYLNQTIPSKVPSPQ